MRYSYQYPSFDLEPIYSLSAGPYVTPSDVPKSKIGRGDVNNISLRARAQIPNAACCFPMLMTIKTKQARNGSKISIPHYLYSVEARCKCIIPVNVSLRLVSPQVFWALRNKKVVEGYIGCGISLDVTGSGGSDFLRDGEQLEDILHSNLELTCKMSARHPN